MCELNWKFDLENEIFTRTREAPASECCTAVLWYANYGVNEDTFWLLTLAARAILAARGALSSFAAAHRDTEPLQPEAECAVGAAYAVF